MIVQNIDVLTAKTWLETKEALFIDVREINEFQQGYILGAVLCPLSNLCDSAISYYDQKMVIYCKKGGRSYQACQYLLDKNSNLKIFNLDGGIEAWLSADLHTAK